MSNSVRPTTNPSSCGSYTVLLKYLLNQGSKYENMQNMGEIKVKKYTPLS